MTGTPFFNVSDQVEFPVYRNSDATRSGTVEIAAYDLRLIKCSKTNNSIVRIVVGGKLEIPMPKSEISVAAALATG